VMRCGPKWEECAKRGAANVDMDKLCAHFVVECS